MLVTDISPPRCEPSLDFSFCFLSSHDESADHGTKGVELLFPKNYAQWSKPRKPSGAMVLLMPLLYYQAINEII